MTHMAINCDSWIWITVINTVPHIHVIERWRASRYGNFRQNFFVPTKKSGRDSSVGISTGYGLDGPGIESRWGARISAPVQIGPGAHPASCTMGTGSFPGVKSGLGVTLTPHPLLMPWSRKGRAIPLHPYGPYGPYRASVSVQACVLPYQEIAIG
jgi:hypothetical protein